MNQRRNGLVLNGRSRVLGVAMIGTLLLLMSACGGSASSSGSSGSYTDKDGWKYSYSSSFGSPTTKAGSSNCPPSPKPGKVVLPFTITLKNVTGGRTAPLPQLSAYSNVLNDGTVRVPDPSPTNSPDGNRGLLYLTPIGFTDGPYGCTSDYVGHAGASALADVDGSNFLKSGKSVTYHGFVDGLPENIPAGTSILVMVGNFSFVGDPTAYWVMNYGKKLENPATTTSTSTTTTEPPPTTLLPPTTTSTYVTTTTRVVQSGASNFDNTMAWLNQTLSPHEIGQNCGGWRSSQGAEVAYFASVYSRNFGSTKGFDENAVIQFFSSKC